MTDLYSHSRCLPLVRNGCCSQSRWPPYECETSLRLAQAQIPPPSLSYEQEKHRSPESGENTSRFLAAASPYANKMRPPFLRHRYMTEYFSIGFDSRWHPYPSFYPAGYRFVSFSSAALVLTETLRRSIPAQAVVSPHNRPVPG